MELFNALYLDYGCSCAGYIRTASIEKNSKINYADMERYISFHDDEDGTKMREFNALRNAKENGALTSKNFFEIKKWFFEAFPNAA